MSFKHWFLNMSAFEMIFLIIGISIPIIFVVAIFFSFRGSSTKYKDAGIFLRRDKWNGELLKTKIYSWQQTNVRYGNDYFYDIYFNLNGDNKIYSAKALISPGQMHLLREGLPIVVKKGRGNNIAIMQIGE